jgi:DNA-binding NarL/FixJ family response regulator
MTAATSPLLVIEDHAVMGHALATALQLQGFLLARALHVHEDLADDEIVAEVAACGEGAVVLLDLHLGDERIATPMIAPMRATGARVLVLTAEREASLLGECLEAGADGVFDKAQPFDQLIDTLNDAMQGLTVMSRGARQDLLTSLRTTRLDDRRRLAPFHSLTSREQDVLRGLLEGHSAEEIAGEHSVALSTVRSHVKSLLRKLGVNSQLAAVALARDAGWPADR